MAMVMFVFLVLFYSMAGLGTGEEALGGSYVFGDSLVDAGNNNYLPTLSKADIRPNGIDFEASAGEPTGRFTNGRTIADLVGTEFSQQIASLRELY